MATTAIVMSDLLPRVRARSVVLVVGGALLTAALAQVEIPLGFTPVPLTLQTFSVLLVGATLGARLAAASMGLSWAMGLGGLPFCAGGTGGWDAGTGATLGYLVGFVAAAAAVGALAERRQDRSFATSLPAMLLGSAIVYAFGSVWLSIDLGVPLATGERNAISLGVAPFLVGDAIKTVIAAACTSAAWAAIGGRADRGA
jgi:biotin transport system substrate-specific component